MYAALEVLSGAVLPAGAGLPILFVQAQVPLVTLLLSWSLVKSGMSECVQLCIIRTAQLVPVIDLALKAILEYVLS